MYMDSILPRDIQEVNNSFKAAVVRHLQPSHRSHPYASPYVPQQYASQQYASQHCVPQQVPGYFTDPIQEWRDFKGEWEYAKMTLSREDWEVFKQQHRHVKDAHANFKRSIKEAKKLCRLLEKHDGDVEEVLNILADKAQRKERVSVCGITV